MAQTQQPLASPPWFLCGGSQMARRIAGHDWSRHPLGPIQSWPVELQNTLALILDSPTPMCLAWSRERYLLCNDACQACFGVDPAAALGGSMASIWGEQWQELEPLIEQAHGGQACHNEDLYLQVPRNAAMEDTWWTVSHSPVRDAAGSVLGVLIVAHETTQRLLAERQLAGQYRRLANLFEQAPNFMAVLRGPEHRFEFANPSYLRILGPREVIGRRMIDVMPDAAEQGYIRILNRVYASGVPFVANSVPFHSRPTPGAPSREFFLDFVYQPIISATGRTEGIFVAGVDVTARTRSENALRRRESELRLLNEELELQVAEQAKERSMTWLLSPDLLCVIGADGLIKATNPAWERVLGWTHAELVRFRARDLIHPDDLEKAREARAFMRGGGNLRDFECRVRTREFTYKVLNWVAARDGGKIYCSARDVTEIRAAAAALAESQARLRSLFEASTQLQGLCSLDGRIQDANQTALDVIQMPLKDVVGKLLWETPWLANTPDAVERVRAAFKKVAKGQTVHEEMTVNLPAGERVYELYVRPMWDASGTISGVVPEAIDITGRRQAEEALRQSQKLEAMGQLTGGVAHDFNNLLAPIVVALELAADPEANPERRARTVAVALQSAERASVLVQRLLAFARKQPLQSRDVDMGSLVEGIAQLMRSSFDPRIRIQVDPGQDIEPARGDANQLEMALLNLGVNARDAMPNGGSLTLSVRMDEPDPVQEPRLRTGRYVVTQVRDTGVGMDAQTLRRAIEPFFSTKGIGKGTGLGLSMAHGLASQLGGVMRIDSTPGVGTIIELWLPASGSHR
jgi:PAS domain S-box-containing protein